METLPPRAVAALFEEHGYHAAGLQAVLGNLEAPSDSARNSHRLLATCSPDSALRVLIRLFFLNVTVPRATLEHYLGEPAISLLCQHELLTAQDAGLASDTYIFPFQDRLICSHPDRHLADPDAGDHVLTVSPAANHLYNFTLREPVDSSLDLACGGGVQALFLADHSRQVVATDLNSRAVAFGRFNGALNDCHNIDWREGDLFAPVQAQRFDLIVCNPPFVLTPDRRYLYRDNPEDLDRLCQRIVAEAPAHLNQGGMLQMILEWVELAGEAWQSRLQGWFEGCGCDVWIFQQHRQTPDRYAHNRLQEMPRVSEAEDAETYQRWMDYYQRHDVAGIHSGLIAMRRRDGDNWFETEEVFDSPREPFGDLVRQRFRNRDFLDVADWQTALLGARPRLAEHLRLVHECVQEEAEWRTLALKLQSVRGMLKPMRVDGVVGQFLGGLDGSRTLGECLDDLLERVSADPRTVRRDCCETVRRMMLVNQILI